MARTEFDHSQFDEAYPPGIERSWWHIARNRTIIRAFRWHVESTARVLEIGCGTGIVVERLRRAGWNAKGAELGKPDVRLDLREHLFLGTDAVELPAALRADIDVIALFDVIEHVPDAAGFLRSLFAAFPNAQQVVVTVPARKELWTTFDDHFGHFRRYDRPLLRAEFTAAGLVPVEASYFFHGLYPAIALNNLLRGRKRNIRFTAPAPGLATAINSVVASAFALETRLLPGSLVGSSIIGIARKP